METPIKSSRRLRIAMFLGLMLLVQGAFAFLLSWIDPPRAPLFVPIHIASRLPQPAASPLFANTLQVGIDRRGIQQSLDKLARHGKNEPVIVYLSGAAVQGEGGSVCILPIDASLDDATTWLPLRDVLEKLKACSSQHKLLVLDLLPPPAITRSGYIYHDIAAALPRELNAVPDADRLVLNASGVGQTPHFSAELGQRVFAHYFHEAVRGHADGYDDARDEHISVKELAAFVQARVERWSVRNRGERQTPFILGAGGDFTIASVGSAMDVKSEPRAMAPAGVAWHIRDAQFRSGAFRTSPRVFQTQLARSFSSEMNHDNDLPAFTDPVSQRPNAGVRGDRSIHVPTAPFPDASKKIFDEHWRTLEQQLTMAKPADLERIKKRFIIDLHGKIPESERDAVAFAHALASPRLDPATLRLCDQLLHPSPRSAEGLRLRLLADLAMRVEVHAWPSDFIETLLRCTDQAEKALRQTPCLPDFVALLDEPALTRHTGEVFLWTRGHSSLDDAKKRLTTAAERFERLNKLNEKWWQCEVTLDETLAELPWYLEALEALPELREPWLKSASAARDLANALKHSPGEKLPWQARVDRLTKQISGAEKHLNTLREHRQALHAPFANDALVRLERQCRSTNADGTTRHVAAAMLRVASPALRADDRVSLGQAVQHLSRRLNDETLALDFQDDEAQRVTPSAEKAPAHDVEGQRAAARSQWQLALLELAASPTNVCSHCGKVSNAVRKARTMQRAGATSARSCTARRIGNWRSNGCESPPGANGNAWLG